MTMLFRSNSDDPPDVARLQAELAESRRKIAELEEKLALFSLQTSILELTIQSTTTPSFYRLKAEWNRPGDPVACERQFQLDEDALLGASFNAEKYGTLLGQALFADNVRDLFTLAQCDDTPLRVLLAVESRELQKWRWERLCGPFEDNQWRPLRPNQRTPFSLFIPTTSERRFPPFRKDELKALVVIASPEEGNSAVVPFDEKLALQTVRDGLGDIPFRVLANLDGYDGPPSLQNIRHQISTGEFTLLHIVCHGALHRESNEPVIFINADETLPGEVERHGRMARVSASTFIQRLNEMGTTQRLPHFAFLSVCDSAAQAETETPRPLGPGAPDWRESLRGFGQRLVRDLGMKAVIAMTDRISQTTALGLGRAFYPALARCGEVDVALAEACAVVRERRDLTTPALFARTAGKRLFTPSTANQPLTDDQITAGVERLERFIKERAPVLVDWLHELKTRLQSGLANEADRRAVLDDLEHGCEESIELSFAEFARGAEPPKYNTDCPFPGLRAFTREQRRYFCGRETLVSTLVERLRVQSFVCVLGGSGSGKSSVVAAGVIPTLLDKQRDLAVARLTPGKDPDATLRAALTQLGEAHEKLLYVDQFEEIFTLCLDQKIRSAFIEDIVEWARPDRRVIMTMRADFLGECAPHTALRRMLQRQPELVPPMTPEELRGAVEDQAKAAGLRYETGLLEMILPELVREPGAMPLVQHALAELWQRRHGRWLRRAAWVDEIGGVAGAIEKTAEDVWTKLEAEDRQLLPTIMTKLVRVGGDDGGGSSRDTRRRVAMGDFYSRGSTDEHKTRVRKLVTDMAGDGARLLVTNQDENTQDIVVEVAHEALLRHWKRFRDWINDSRDMLVMKQDVRISAQDWINSGKKVGAFLEHRDIRGEVVRTMIREKGLEVDEQPMRATKNVSAGESPTVGTVREYLDACEAADRAEQEKAERIAEEKRKQLEALEAALNRVRDNGLVGAARACLASGDPTLANRLLLAVKDPVGTPGWLACAYEMTGVPIARAVLGHPLLEGVTPRLGAKFSPDSKRILTVVLKNDKYILRSWAADKPTELVESVDLDGEPLWFAADGTRVITTSNGNTAIVWERNGSGPFVESFKLETSLSVITSAQVSADGKLVVLDEIARFGDKGTACVWERDGSGSFVERFTFGRYDDPLTAVALSSDGKRIVTASVDKTVRLWERSWEQEGAAPFIERFKIEMDSVHYVGFSPDHKRVVTSSVGADVQVWELADSGAFVEPHTLEGHTSLAYSAAFNNDGDSIVTASSDQTAGVWELGGSGRFIEFKGHKAGVFYAAFSPDDTSIVTASDDGTTRIWELEHVALVVTLDSLSSAVLSRDGKWIVATHHYYGPCVWELDSSDEFTAQHSYKEYDQRFFEKEKLVALSAAFAQDGLRVITTSGERMATGDYETTVRVWEIDRSGRVAERCRLEGDKSWLESAAFSVDGKRIVTSHNGGTWVWELDSSGKLAERRKFGGDEHMQFFSAAFSNDGKRIVTTPPDATVRVWELDGSGVFIERDTLKWNTMPQVNALSAEFSNDDKRIVTAHADNSVRVWELGGSGKFVEKFKLIGHTALVKSAAFNVDGKRIVTASDDKTARVWNLDGSGTFLELRGHKGPVYSAVFTPNGKRVVTASLDGTVRVWEIDAETVREKLRNASSIQLTPAERQTYLLETPEEARTRYEEAIESVYGRTPALG